MAIQVSYLESGLYPSWFKTGPESVSSVGEMPSVKHETVSSFGEMPTVKAGRVRGFLGRWPRVAKHEEVKSFSDLKGEPASSDDWLEIGQPYFHVMVEASGAPGQDLGYWVKLDGLAMKVDVAEHRTGDGMNYRWMEPTISTCPNIKLSRAATARGCKQTLAWLIDAQSGWKRGMTAGITAKPMWHKAEESAWFKVGLVDVIPVSWSTNGFATDGKLAMETLELAFSHFERPDANPPFPTPPPVKPRAEAPTPPAPPPERTLADLRGGQAAATGES